MLRILTATYGSSFQPGPWSYPGEEGGPCRVERVTGEEGLCREPPLGVGKMTRPHGGREVTEF